MKAKLLQMVIVCFFAAATGASPVRAAVGPDPSLVFESAVSGLQKEFTDADLSGPSEAMAALTVRFLDAVLVAGLNGDADTLALAVSDYTADLEKLKEEALDPACGLPLVLNAAYKSLSMLQLVSYGGDPFCTAVSLSFLASSILFDVYTYNICVLDASPEPDQEARDGYVQKQKTIKVFNVIMQIVNMATCMAEPGITDYLNLFLSFLAIFK